jgi:hypothetical protein
MRSVRIHEAASEEAVEAAAWYENQRPGLGADFQRAIDRALDLLEEGIVPLSPVPTTAKALGVKRLVLRRFPFDVVVVERPDEVLVLAFAHHARRPGYWRQRNRDSQKADSLIAREFEFVCVSCGQVHRGIPTFGADAPLAYYGIPEEERGTRCILGANDCVIDQQTYLIRGCIEIPVTGERDPFVWGVWVSLSEQSFEQYRQFRDIRKRSHVGPFFGWLNSWLKPYPDTTNLKTRVHLRDDGIRPYIELEPTEHPLAIEQRVGISKQRVAEIYALMVHESPEIS